MELFWILMLAVIIPYLTAVAIVWIYQSVKDWYYDTF